MRKNSLGLVVFPLKSEPVSGEMNLTESTVAQVLNVSVKAVQRWRTDPQHPLRYRRYGRCVRYRWNDVLEYMDAAEPV